MAKQIIILGISQSSTEMTVNAVFWYPISQGMLTRTSGSQWTGASLAENTAIQSGGVLEEGQSFSFPVGTLPATIKDVFNKAWAQRNSALGGVGPAQYNGIYYDGTTGWSA